MSVKLKQQVVDVAPVAPSSWRTTTAFIGWSSFLVVLTAIVTAAVIYEPTGLYGDTALLQDIRSSTSTTVDIITQQMAARRDTAVVVDAPAAEPQEEPIIVAVAAAAAPQKAPIEIPTPSSDPIADLTAHLLANGAALSTFDKVLYGDIAAGNRGLHSTRDLSVDDVIISLPERELMTNAIARASPIGQRCATILPDVFTDADNQFLAVYLLTERRRGSASPYHPYIASLPKHYDNCPINYRGDDLRYLRESGTSLYEALYSDDAVDLRSYYARICAADADFCTTHSYDDYVWARMTVRTRAFSIRIDEVEMTALMPYADLFNHDSDNAATWRFNDATRRMEIYMLRSVDAGQPVTLSYGAKSNRRLLSNYGFALTTNPHDTAVVFVQLPDGESATDLLTRRVALTGDPTTAKFRIRHEIGADSTGDEFLKALALARIAVATSDELDAMTGSGYDMVSLRNEMAALSYLQTEVGVALMKFPQDLDHDDQLLLAAEADADLLTDNQRNVVLVRRGEKRVLVAAVGILDDLMRMAKPLLSQSEFDRKRFSSKYVPHESYMSALAQLRRDADVE